MGYKRTSVILVQLDLIPLPQVFYDRPYVLPDVRCDLAGLDKDV
jgi:hypothetical protein